MKSVVVDTYKASMETDMPKDTVLVSTETADATNTLGRALL